MGWEKTTNQKPPSQKMAVTSCDLVSQNFPQNDLECLAFIEVGGIILEIEIRQNVPKRNIEMKNKRIIVLICRG